jgi:hypothetical protein
MVHVPSQIPSSPTDPAQPQRIVLAVEWTRGPAYAVVAQSALNRLKTARIHWIDLYTGPLTWQIRDRAGLLSMIELFTRVHQTAIAVFADGDHYDADPTGPDYHVA